MACGDCGAGERAAKAGRSLICAASAEAAYRGVSHTVADTALVTELHALSQAVGSAEKPTFR